MIRKRRKYLVVSLLFTIVHSGIGRIHGDGGSDEGVDLPFERKNYVI
jgi:hypothetical protein